MDDLDNLIAGFDKPVGSKAAASSSAAAAAAPAKQPERTITVPSSQPAGAADDDLDALLFGLNERMGAIGTSREADVEKVAQRRDRIMQHKLYRDPQSEARALQGMGARSAAIVKEINRVRETPQSYVSILQRRKAQFEGKALKYAATNTQLDTKEGTAAVDEAIHALQSAKKKDALIPHSGVAAAAADACARHGNEGTVDVKDTLARLQKYGDLDGTAVEILAFGVGDVEEQMCRLLVADGDSQRKTRHYVFEEWTFIGVAVAAHSSSFKEMVTIGLCSNIVPRE